MECDINLWLIRDEQFLFVSVGLWCVVFLILWMILSAVIFWMRNQYTKRKKKKGVSALSDCPASEHGTCVPCMVPNWKRATIGSWEPQTDLTYLFLSNQRGDRGWSTSSSAFRWRRNSMTHYFGVQYGCPPFGAYLSGFPMEFDL